MAPATPACQSGCSPIISTLVRIAASCRREAATSSPGPKARPAAIAAMIRGSRMGSAEVRRERKW